MPASVSGLTENDSPATRNASGRHESPSSGEKRIAEVVPAERFQVSVTGSRSMLASEIATSPAVGAGPVAARG